MEPDEDYIFKINELIPKAVSIANRELDIRGVGGERRIGVDGQMYIHDVFSELFHKAMNKLAFEMGLRPWK